jgi:hypothetical protein
VSQAKKKGEMDPCCHLYTVQIRNSVREYMGKGEYLLAEYHVADVPVQYHTIIVAILFGAGLANWITRPSLRKSPRSLITQ